MSSRSNSPADPTHLRSFAVIGGGISGLATAYYLHRRQPTARIRLFESRDTVGGVLRTGRTDGYLHELSADNFLVSPDLPWARELAEELDYADELIPTSAENRRALVYWHGRLHAIPEGFQLMATANPWPLITSSLLSWKGKLRLGWERFVPASSHPTDESLAQFATRRVGHEAYERLVQPLVAGIYTADPTRLSVAAALPQFPAMESKYGSLTRGMVQRARESAAASGASGARYAMFSTPRLGMQDLIRKLASALPEETLQCDTHVRAIHRTSDDKWTVVRENEAAHEVYDGVAVALPTWQAADVLRDENSLLADALAAIRYANAAVVAVGVRNDQLPKPPKAFGIVVPAAAQRQILAVSFSSLKFPNRAPEGHTLIRVFVGGACQESLVDLDDPSMRQLVRNELRDIIQLQGEPLWWHIQRWHRATPQYEIGHLDRVAQIEQLIAPYRNLALAGNGYRGVGMPQCIRQGQLAAERLSC